MSTTATGSPRTATPLRHFWPHAGARLFVAYWLSLTAVDAVDGVAALVAVAAVVAVCAARQPRLVALAVAGEGWLFLVGFESNAHGVLAPHLMDLPRLLVLLAAALAVTHVRNTREGAR